MVLAFHVEAFWHSLVQLQGSLGSLPASSSLKMTALYRWPAGQQRQVTSPFKRVEDALTERERESRMVVDTLPGPDLHFSTSGEMNRRTRAAVEG